MIRPSRIAIATDTPGWHGRRLAEAFARHGMEATFVSLPHCRIDLHANRFGLVIPGFVDRLPDAVLVREIAAGSFEQVTVRLGILHALAEWGVTVCNSARAVERSVDKSMTSLLLHRAGIPTPPTWVTENAEAARDVLTNAFAQGHRIVSKPLFGSQGKGLLRLAPGDALPPSESCNGLYYLQRFVETAADATGDWRVFVIGDEAVAAMRRRGTDWIHNVSRGGKTEAARLEPDLCDLAVRATRAVGADYAGVDLIRDGNGAATVLEVNGIPAWQGLQSVTTIDIADRLVRYLVDVHRAQRSSASGPAGKLK